MSESSSSPNYLALYEHSSKYEQEFQNNLESCRKEFLNLVPNNQNEIVSVAAPGSLIKKTYTFD
jgi:hypothetical protein